MSHFDRRDLLRWALGGIAAGPVLAASAPMRALERAARIGAAQPVITQKVLLIFMRGGMDGVLALIPDQDPTYVTSRNIGSAPPYVPTANSLSLAPMSTFARLHPRMYPLLGSFSPFAQNQVAFLHQVGNSTGERSHFTEMARLETGHVIDPVQLPEDGFIPRIGAQLGWPNPATTIQTASVSDRMQRLFQSASRPQVHLRDVIAFRNRVFDPALVSHLANTPAAAVERVVDGLGDLMLNAWQDLQTATIPPHNATLFPTAGDPWPLIGARKGQFETFFRDLEGAVNLLTQTGCRVAGVELGNFDTHANERVVLDDLLEVIAYGLRSVWIAGQGSGSLLTTLAMSEFGRGARANGNNGTDHGLGGLMIACGQRVVGGVYNCSAATWSNLNTQFTLPVTNPAWNAVPVRTHWLAVFQEIIAKVFGITSLAQQNLVLPGLPTIAGQSVAQQLNFL